MLPYYFLCYLEVSLRKNNGIVLLDVLLKCRIDFDGITEIVVNNLQLQANKLFE